MSDWQILATARYLNLESYRRDGTPVRTPLWFAELPGALVAYTVDDTPKVKRLRRAPRCRIAACDMRGNLTGPWLDARAELLPPGPGHDMAMRTLNRKYWPWKQLLGLAALLRPGRRRVVIAFTPA